MARARFCVLWREHREMRLVGGYDLPAIERLILQRPCRSRHGENDTSNLYLRLFPIIQKPSLQHIQSAPATLIAYRSPINIGRCGNSLVEHEVWDLLRFPSFRYQVDGCVL